MIFKFFKKTIFFVVCLNLIFSIFLTPDSQVKAAGDKTITITFKTAPTPTSVVVTKAPLKFNKNFAFSYTFDDGYIEGYNPAFRYMHGGRVDELGKIVGGLYFTDGAGSRIPFKGALNWFSNSSSTFGDLHVNTPSNMTWHNLREVYSLGWEPINHGWTSMTTPSPSNTIVNYPIEHGGPRTIDYNYEVTQNTSRLLAELGVTIKHFGLPAGDINYLPAALANGMKSISTGQPGGNENEGLINVAPIIPLDQLQYKRKFFTETTTFQDMKTYIDKISNDSTEGANYWGVASSHRVRTPVNPPDSGNLSFDNFKNFMDYVANTYGADGNDSVWMASFPEIYEYLAVKQKTSISAELSGHTLTISLDTSLVDGDLRRYALSLIVNADVEIDNISYNESEFTHHSENISTGLINLDWGFVSLENDLTRAEELVSIAEVSKVRLDVDTARIYVDLLENSSEKNDFFARLDSIEVNLKSWKVNFGNNGYTSGPWNEYGGNLVSHNALTLKDSDNNDSSVTVKIQQDFSSKASTAGKTADPANTGYFPDAYLAGLVRMYSASTNVTPGAVRLGGLDINKKYQIVLMGSHNLVDATTDKTKTVYSINGEEKELQTSLNTMNVVTYNNLSPDVSGNIDIYVAKKFANWGYGVLNALQITEEREYTLAYSAGSHGSIIGNTSQLVSAGANGTEVVAVPEIGYHFINWSDGITTPSRTDLNIHANKSVSANFVVSQYALTLDSQGGSAFDPKMVTYGQSIGSLPVPTKAGNTFSGWFTEANGQGVRYESSSVYLLTENIVLVAHWIPSQVAFNYNNNTWYPTIQSAIDAANSNDTINISAGTFNERLIVNKPLTLNGDSATTTIINGEGLGNPITVNAPNVSITNLKVTNSHADSDAAGVRVNSGYSNFNLSNVDASGNNGSGIHVTSGSSTIANCTTDDNIWGIRIDFGSNFVIDNCTVSNNQRYDAEAGAYGQGIRIVSVASSSIINSRIFNNAREGILITESAGDSENITVDNSLVHGNGVMVANGGLSILNAHDIFIKNSTVRDNAGTGVRTGTSLDVEIDNNIIYGNSVNNIFFTTSNNGVIKNNTLGTSTPADNLRLDRSDNFEIFNNEIYSTGVDFYALSLTGSGGNGSDNSNIYNNTIRNNANGIKLEQSSAGNSIRNNQIYSSTNYGVRVFAGTGINNIIKSNNIYNNKYGLRVNSDGNTFYDNRFANTTSNIFSSSGVNTWNISQSLGPNILGGTYYGGNNWSNYGGVDANGDGFGDTAYVVTGVSDNLPLVSAYTQTYVLNYVAGDNGSILGTSTQIINHGLNGSEVTAVPDDNYDFLNWSDGSTENPRTDLNVTESKSLTANFSPNQYVLSFNSNEGSAVSPITQDYNSLIVAPENPVREGYTFSGWYPELPSLMPGSNQNYTAQWTINQYTITFDSAGGSTISAITQDYNSAVTAPANPTKTGHSFSGWSPFLPANMPLDGSFHVAQWTLNPEPGPKPEPEPEPEPEDEVETGTNSNSVIALPPGTGSGTRDATVEAGVGIGSNVQVGEITPTGVNVLTYITNTNNFLAPQSSNNWQPNPHTFIITDLDLFHNRVEVTFRSEPKIINLNLGESREVDLDGDGISDIIATFSSLYVNRAEITIKSLSETFKTSTKTESNIIDHDFIIAKEKELTEKIDINLANRLNGRLLLQVEEKGQAWYLEPISKKRYFMGRPADAFDMMRHFGLGISEEYFSKFEKSGAPSRFAGRILLRVEESGEAYYVNPVDMKMYYLGRPSDAFKIMRELALGISNENIRKILVEALSSLILK